MLCAFQYCCFVDTRYERLNLYPWLGNTLEFNTRLYFKDHLGSIRNVTDTLASTLRVRDYYPYGEIARDNPILPDSGRYQFTEKERDSETGFDYFGARYFDSEIGIWNCADLLEDHFLGISPYSYCFNNPIILKDITGYWPTLIHHRLTHSAFKEVLTQNEIALLNSVHNVVDKKQAKEESYYHAMIEKGKSKEIGLDALNKLIVQEFGEITTEKGLRKFGEALHALQDYLAPAHHNKEWDGDLFSLKAIPHFLNESNIGEIHEKYLASSVQISNYAYQSAIKGYRLFIYELTDVDDEEIPELVSWAKIRGFFIIINGVAQ